MRLAPHIARLLSIVLIWAGGAATLWGALQPWIVIKIFRTIEFAAPGFFFTGGRWCLGIAFIVLLGLRRVPTLCALAALLLLTVIAQARVDAPRRAKHHLIGIALTLSPVNRVLDQAHLPDLEISDWSIPNPQLLGPGIATAWDGALCLLAGSLLGLPSDPLLLWSTRRRRTARCAHCETTWPDERAASFCPHCGAPTPLPSPLLCRVCGATPLPTDRHCIACGAPVSEIRKSAAPPL